ncbi:MAG: transcriptional repressor [Armatimonadota bacterium]|nr:transcriptional repressor [Armatimonadota bacterium]
MRHPVVRQRNTRQRGAILAAIEAASCHLTAEDLYRRLRRGPRPIGLATIYRALDAFVREGLVEPAHVGDGRVRYGLAAKHHDHLVCLGCGAWRPLERCLVIGAPRRMSGFVVTGHQLEVFGYCARCRQSVDRRGVASRGARRVSRRRKVAA